MGNVYRFSKFIMVCFFISLFITKTFYAQGSVTLQGMVTDKSTGEGLTGANIIVRGTSVGTASDLDGKYVIHGVPSGRQTIVVSYIGYVADTLRIDLPQRGTVEQNFTLAATILEGELVTVTAQAQGQLQAINQQLSSDKIANIVSEQRIQQLPDFNAAQAISRLPGVSTTQSSGEANKVVIRGLAPQYNQVSIAGVSMAASSSSDRSVDLTQITPYMIKSIQVYKSLTPDMNANAVGGVVNMDLREAPEGLRSDLMWQSGYTDKTSNYGNYRGVASVSQRFFDNSLGVYALGNIEKYDRDADNMNAGYTVAQSVAGAEFNPVRVTQITLSRHREVRKRYGASLEMDYNLGYGSILFSSFLIPN